MITLGSSPSSLSNAAAQIPSLARSSVDTSPPAATGSLADVVQVQSSAAGLTNLVRPTEAQLVQQLYRQGHTVPQISSSLSLSVVAVDNYLQISRSSG